jgi:hypothetical protein
MSLLGRTRWRIQYDRQSAFTLTGASILLRFRLLNLLFVGHVVPPLGQVNSVSPA